MIRSIAVAAFALAIATSAQAIPVAPLHQADGIRAEAYYRGHGYRGYGGYRHYGYGVRRYGYGGYGYRPYGYGAARGVARRNIRRGVRRNW